MNDVKQKLTIVDGYNYIWKQSKAYWEKYGSRVMTIAGTTGLFLTGVHACRKTYKNHDKLKENGKKLAEAKAYLDGEGKLKHTGRIAKETGKCAVKTARLYAADIIAGGASAYMVKKGWHKEHQHYQQAAAMVGVIMADFMNYRGNVISEHGKEADRRYLTTKREYIAPDGTKKAEKGKKTSNTADDDVKVVQLKESDLRIWYSKETTPQVWSESHILRMNQLERIRNDLEYDLVYGGSYSINDVRREFYGRKGDIPNGGMYGRIWDPGNPEHPERGKFVNLHYEDDEDFMSGRTDSCWIIIDIDPDPLFETLEIKKQDEIEKSIR